MYQLLIFTIQNNCCQKYALNDIDTNLTFYKSEEELMDTLVNEFRSELSSLSDQQTYKFLEFVIYNKYISKIKTCSCGKLFVISTKTQDTNMSSNRLFQLIDESQISILLDDFYFGSFTTELNNNNNNNIDDEMMERNTKKRRTY